MVHTGRYICTVLHVSERSEREEMQRLLRYANYAKVGAALGVERATVARWAAGKNVTLGRLEQVRALLGDAEKTPPGEPDGAMRTVAEMAAEETVRRLVPPEILERAAEILRERLATTPPPSAEAPHEETSGPGQGRREPQGQ